MRLFVRKLKLRERIAFWVGPIGCYLHHVLFDMPTLHRGWSLCVCVRCAAAAIDAAVGPQQWISNSWMADVFPFRYRISDLDTFTQCDSSTQMVVRSVRTQFRITTRLNGILCAPCICPNDALKLAKFGHFSYLNAVAAARQGSKRANERTLTPSASALKCECEYPMRLSLDVAIQWMPYSMQYKFHFSYRFSMICLSVSLPVLRFGSLTASVATRAVSISNSPSSRLFTISNCVHFSSTSNLHGKCGDLMVRYYWAFVHFPWSIDWNVTSQRWERRSRIPQLK